MAEMFTDMHGSIVLQGDEADAVRLFEEVWSDGMLHEHIATLLTCGEAEALAGILRVLGGDGAEETVDYLISAHSWGDSDPEDQHYHLFLSATGEE